jgi:sporulation protein YlmC with PRC-barrel domain
MKRLLVGFVVVLFAGPLVVSAQTTRPADRPARDTKADRPAWKHDTGLHEAKEIIGTRIKNAEGKDLGEVDQLLIDPKSGKVSHVVIGLGGLAGVGEKKVVVPWSDLMFAGAAQRNAITMDQAKLESAPRYDRSARTDAAPAASPRTSAGSPVKDSDKDGKSDHTDKAPLDPTRK